MQDVSYHLVNVATENGVTRCELKGVATCVEGSKAFTLDLLKQNETFKVVKFKFEPDPN